MVDIDALLAEGKLELKLGGQEYALTDIDVASFMSTLNSDEVDPLALRNQLAKLLGVEENMLEGVGLRGVSLALREVRDWLTSTTEAEAGGDPVSP